MPAVTLSEPTTAERVRTACVRAGGAMLAADGVPPVDIRVHHLLPDGTFAVTVADGCPIAIAAGKAAGGVAAVLELTDYAPLALREPVRSLVWARGRVRTVDAASVRQLLDVIAAEHPNPALLDVGAGQVLLALVVESVVVADRTGAEPVRLGALLAAQPDPFCDLEPDWVRHLEADHPEVMIRLARRLPAALRKGRVRPLGLDRYGISLRIEGPSEDHDVRLPFSAPVHDVTGLGKAIRALMGCPFANGLRARPGGGT
ncbi:MAG: DUF2470 domain-containing protein [Mycobacterium sp.]